MIIKNNKKKANILLIPDVKNWAFDLRANELIFRLKHKYNFNKAYWNPFDPNDKNKYINFDKYDLIYFFYICQFPVIKNILEKKNVSGGIFSYDEWQADLKNTINNINKLNALSVGTPGLYKIFSKYCNNIFYTPTGVNTDFFKPHILKNKNNFTVGWVGNPKRKFKGYYEYVVPACQKAKVKLMIAAKGINFIPRLKLPHFYNEIDCLLCASSEHNGEGGAPNPNFEAAACGKPIITTKVGLMPEFIKDGKNGIFIDRNITSIVKAINTLKNNKNLCGKMGKQARSDIVRKWSWDKMISNYDKFFAHSLKINKI